MEKMFDYLQNSLFICKQILNKADVGGRWALSPSEVVYCKSPVK